MIAFIDLLDTLLSLITCTLRHDIEESRRFEGSAGLGPILTGDVLIIFLLL